MDQLLARDDAGGAEAHLHKALETQREAGLLSELLCTKEAIADGVLRKERHEDAVRVSAYVDHARADMHFVRGNAEEDAVRELTELLALALGRENFAESRRSAAQSDLQVIIGLISRMRGKRA